MHGSGETTAWSKSRALMVLNPDICDKRRKKGVGYNRGSFVSLLLAKAVTHLYTIAV